MSTIEVPDHVAARLAAEAARRGITVEQLLASFAEALPDPEAIEGQQRPPRRLGFVSLGASTSGRHAREADVILAEGFGETGC